MCNTNFKNEFWIQFVVACNISLNNAKKLAVFTDIFQRYGFRVR